MDSEASSKNPTIAKLKLLGACSGVLDAELEVWTVRMLREEVAKRCDCEPKWIKLICGGRLLKDEEKENLSELNIKINSKILSIRVYEEMIADVERSRKQAQIKAAVVSLSNTYADVSLSVEEYSEQEDEVENEDGQKFQIESQTDRRGLMMGILLHTYAKHLIKQEKYKDALDVLVMGEEAYALCNPKILETLINDPMLQVDMVWCYFMLRDVKWLSIGKVRLENAREGLECFLEKDSSKENSYVALYLRLELLEGVVAYHNGEFEKSQKALISAQTRCLELQEADESPMDRPAKRVCIRPELNLVEKEEKKRKAQRTKERIWEGNEMIEQRFYGMTPLNKDVDLQKLNHLISLGFEKENVAEALRSNENNIPKAIEDLTNPKMIPVIQLGADLHRKKGREIIEAVIQTHVSRGYERSAVVASIKDWGKQKTKPSLPTEDPTLANVAYLNSRVNVTEDPLDTNKTDETDLEMEDAILQELIENPLERDLEITKEGEAIIEYLALLASTGNN